MSNRDRRRSRTACVLATSSSSVNDQPVTSVDAASAALDRVAVGRNARVVVSRNGQETLVLMRKR